MNGPNYRFRVTPRFLKAALLGVTFVVAGASSAAEMNDVVTTRGDQDTAQQHGRDSVYALSSAPVYRSAQLEPQRYGRAGGYVGSDRIEVFKSSPRVGEGAVSAESGRTSGDRFDHTDSGHGQDELNTQTR